MIHRHLWFWSLVTDILGQDDSRVGLYSEVHVV